MKKIMLINCINISQLELFLSHITSIFTFSVDISSHLATCTFSHVEAFSHLRVPLDISSHLATFSRVSIEAFSHLRVPQAYNSLLKEHTQNHYIEKTLTCDMAPLIQAESGRWRKLHH